MTTTDRTGRGFTLIELMIVIAIIGIIAAIAIPNLIESRKRSNESSAISTLRTIATSQQIFKDRDLDGNGRQDYAGTGSLLRDAGLIRLMPRPDGTDNDYNSGYIFGVEATEHTFRAVGAPYTPRKSGDRSFYVDETGVIRFSSTKLSEADIDAETDFTSWPPIGD